MVMSFFRRGESGLEHVEHQTVAMLGDARHSFDLACSAVLGGADPNSVGDDVAATDERINEAEQNLRSELVVHISVRGAGDIGLVMSYTLLLKKIERVGDQAKNILDLALDGVSLAGSDDVAELLALARTISEMYREAGELLASQDEPAAREFLERSMALNDQCGAKVRELVRSDEPGHWAVPRAILYRYWKRIVANLGGIVTSAIEPVTHIDYLDDGETDIDDD